MSKFLKSFPTIKNINRTIYVIISILCMLVITSCDDNPEEDRDELVFIEVDIEGIDDYTVEKERFRYTCFIPSEGADFVVNGCDFSCITLTQNQFCEISYRYKYTVPKDLENYNFYGEWSSVVYESLTPYKYRVHVEPNETGLSRSFRIEMNHYPCMADIVIIQS